ncbi:hypothetical protein [Tateyamaria sp. syn59]|uniref:hypothetical protein n=1 Tax=Tateyamaria sp. syn59 TaxID=2576942 RepID=UPI0016733FA1|nr:hypothetical protein [Tateyamaria sp. syn59]
MTKTARATATGPATACTPAASTATTGTTTACAAATRTAATCTAAACTATHCCHIYSSSVFLLSIAAGDVETVKSAYISSRIIHESGSAFDLNPVLWSILRN